MTLSLKILSALVSETVRCMRVGTLIRGCRCTMSWCNLDLTLDLAVVTLTFKILSGLYTSEFVRCRKLILGKDISCGVCKSWYDRDLTFDHAVVTLNFKLLSRLYLGNCKV